MQSIGLCCASRLTTSAYPPQQKDLLHVSAKVRGLSWTFPRLEPLDVPAPKRNEASMTSGHLKCSPNIRPMGTCLRWQIGKPVVFPTPSIVAHGSISPYSSRKIIPLAGRPRDDDPAINTISYVPRYLAAT